MKSAKPVLAGNKIKWTLEAVEQTNPDLVRVDWLRFTVPMDSVIPKEQGGPRDTSWLYDTHYGPDWWDRYHRGMYPAHLAIQIASVDSALTYTTPRIISLEGAKRLVEALPGVFEVGVTEDSGMDFYVARTAVLRQGLVVGWVLAGGKSSAQAGTVHYNLFGSACLHLGKAELSQLYVAMYDMGAWITRVDLALDVWSGLDIERVRDAYLSGQFDVRGKRPNQQEHGSWTNGHSRTFQVGSRDSGKLMRAYEKGDELFGHEMNDPWIRLEGELRNNQRIIDLEVLLKPGDYFAGLYPFCRDFLVEQQVYNESIRIPTHNQVKDTVALAAVTGVALWARNTAGPAIAALWTLGGDLIADIVSASQHRTPGRLLGFSKAELQKAFDQVASAIAPPDAHYLYGAA